jgi:hypothetical protein
LTQFERSKVVLLKISQRRSWGVWYWAFLFGALLVFNGTLALVLIAIYSHYTTSAKIDWSIYLVMGGAVLLGMLICIYSYQRKEHSNLESADTEARLAGEDIIRTKKVYAYYCKGCLYQTNKFSKSCPRCRDGVLVKVK